MDWLALSLTAAALWGASSVVDKIMMGKHISNPLIYSLFFGTYGLASALVVGSTVQIHIEPTGATLLAFLSGSLHLIYIMLYFAAMGRSDATVVVALGQITPVFAALWDYLILGEVFSVATYAGVIIMMLGAVLISLERNKASIRSPVRLDTTLLLMVAACFVRSFSDLILKYALEEISAWDGFFWPRLGIFAGALVVLAFVTMRQQWWVTIKRLGRRMNLLIMGSEVTALGGTLAITLAYDRGPLTLVSASGSTQPLFIVLFVWVVNLIRQSTVPDRTNLRLCAMRLLPLFMLIFGAYLLGEG